MGAAMPDPVITQRRIQVEHVRIEAAKPFAEVKAALEELLPPRDSAIPEALRHGRIGQAKGRCGTVWSLLPFNGRDQWRIAAHCCLPRKDVQYEIGNPFTAIRMTQYQLAGPLATGAYTPT